jgi:hypothetical protein
MLQWTFCNQCCGAETFCFRSGSDFQKVSAPAPELAPAPTLALYIPFITDFILKSGFFMFLKKEYQPNSHAGFYRYLYTMNFDFYLLLKLTRSREPKLRHSGSGSSQKFRLHIAVCNSASYCNLDVWLLYIL